MLKRNKITEIETKKENTNKPRLFPLKEAATLIDGLTEYRLRILCRENAIKFYMFGNKYMVSEKVVMEYFSD